ncbi:MAG TPA: hypothetical protein VLF67_03020 [Candidatus Saccharimonas sp.]|nr:hypothetical protein [Candidatus Saccharimonas sp.]
MNRNQIFVGVLVTVSALAIGAQVVLGGPVKQDKDLSTRITDFNNQVQQYYSEHQMLPVTDVVLTGDHTGIEYQVMSETAYQICGTFQTTNRPKGGTVEPQSIAYPTYIDATVHDRGHVCFAGMVGVFGKPVPL